MVLAIPGCVNGSGFTNGFQGHELRGEHPNLPVDTETGHNN